VVEPLILLAHRAGTASSHPWMQRWAERLGVFARVVRFDYTYMREGRRSPDRLPRLIETHREALRAARSGHTGPVVLCGKSLGGRVGCHVALEESVAGLVCLGYPLVGASARRPLRDAVLRELSTRILFVQGTRDALCPLDQLERVRAQMLAPSELHVVEGGDHSLAVPKRQLAAAGEQQADVDARACAVIRRFVELSAGAAG